MSDMILVAALPGWKEVVTCFTAWGLLLAVVGLFLLVPPNTRRKQVIGGALAVLGLGFLIIDQLRIQNWPFDNLPPYLVFWGLATVAIVGGVGTISAQSPIYSAIWFALSLLGVAALFMFQDAQFLGVATVIVYAGAIVVTFLFVLMLAQPEGHSVADRISWGIVPKVGGVIAAGALVGFVAHAIHPPAVPKAEGETAAVEPIADGTLRDKLVVEFPELAERLVAVKLQPAADAPAVFTLVMRNDATLPVPEADILHTLQPVAENATLSSVVAPEDVRSQNHVANLGGYLFSRQLIAVELAGTLLLAALVGAVGMVIQGRLAKEGAPHE